MGRIPAVGLVAWLVLVGLSSTPAAQQGDAAVLLAAARQALGGEAALAGVLSLKVEGSYATRVGPGLTASFESNWISPDRFLKISRRTTGGPVLSFQITDYDGFRGNEPIRETEAPNAPFPVVIPGPQPVTGEELMARRTRALDGMRQIMVETMVPLFIALPTQYEIDLVPAGKVQLPTGGADAIDLKRADGKTWRLLLDEKTHLPVQLAWKAKPVIMMSTSSTMTSRGAARVGPGGIQVVVPSSGVPAGGLPADPTAGVDDVDWVMTIGDFKLADGVNWPRRFKKSFSGQEWEDVRVSRYRINPKIDPKIFERGK